MVTLFMSDLNDISSKRIDLNSHVTIFYGKNNSGKSYLLTDLYNEYEKRALVSHRSIPISIILGIDRLNTAKKEAFAYMGDYSYESFYLQFSKLGIDIRNRIIQNDLLSNTFITRFINRLMVDLFGDIIMSNPQISSDGICNAKVILSSIIYSLSWKNLSTPQFYAQIDEEKWENILSSDGLVFIDEIDDYLHLSVQEKMVSILRKTFPNVYFIFTTHSPLILSRTKDMDAFEICSNGDERYLKHVNTGDLYYQNIETIAIDEFDVSRFPEDVEELIDYFSSLFRGEIQFVQKDFNTKRNLFESKYPNVYNKYYETIFSLGKKYEI